MSDPFVHLHTHSCFSFLDGASWPQDLIKRAQTLGMDTLALTDHNGLYGAVRFYQAATSAGIRPILGAEVEFYPPGQSSAETEMSVRLRENSGSANSPPFHLTLLAKNYRGYQNLCKLITCGQLRGNKRHPILLWEDLQRYSEHLFALSGCPRGEIPTLIRVGLAEAAMSVGRRYLDLFGVDHFLIEQQNMLLSDSASMLYQMDALSRVLGVRTVATNNVHYALRERFRVHDVLTCIRTITTLDDRHPERKSNAEYYLKSSAAMNHLFKDYPDAIRNTRWVADQCSVDLQLGLLHFPYFPLPPDESSYSYLCKLCFQGAEDRYRPITPEVMARLQHELEIIHDLGFAEYFLVVWDIVRYARKHGIRFSGRGSAVGSILTYCLGVTTVDPIEHNLLFERFLNRERRGVPDIDIDFCAQRRDEVIHYIYETYGSDHVAMVCTFSSLSARAAVRDVGKAMGFSSDQIDRVAKVMPHTSASRIREAAASLPELRDANLGLEKMQDLFDICEAVDGFPRHVSVHLAGVLITQDPLTDYTPLEWSTRGVVVSQFNKDDVETLGLVKLDVLGLRNLSAIEYAVNSIKQVEGVSLDMDSLPLDDPETYALLRTTHTVGVFQVESPGMRGVLGRLQPEGFDDIVANIALFRPGPMKANMIDPFIQRRHGLAPVIYPHPSVMPALQETYGVLIFQEQVLRIASAAAGFSMGEADRFRRAMTHDRSPEEMEGIREAFLAGAQRQGLSTSVAEEIFGNLASFAGYGFCKAHAAAFAKIAYQTAYLKAHYPAEFLAGILSNEPMGFYSASSIVQEARRMGIPVLQVDINRSEDRYSVEWIQNSESDIRRLAIRVSLSVVRDITQGTVRNILSARKERPFNSLRDFCVRTRASQPIAENLIRCGAFDSVMCADKDRTAHCSGAANQSTYPPQIGVARRVLFWQLQDAIQATAEGYPCVIDPTEMDRGFYQELYDVLPAPNLAEQVQTDYEVLGFTTHCHPMTFYRRSLIRRGVESLVSALKANQNQRIKVAGVVISCMRPPTRSGKVVVFITLEDETGMIDCTVFPEAYNRLGNVLFHSTALIVEGRLQRMGASGLNLIVEKAQKLESQGQGAIPVARPDCPSGFNRICG